MATQFANTFSVPPRCGHPRTRDCSKKCEGTYQFNREQTYQGEFLREGLHGQGNYKWLNVALYDGGFYSNCKEGYASISFPDSSYFEGLFVGNQPFGPGVLTHANGRQDAGFWKGRKLVRLSRAVDFIIPRLAPTSAAKIKLLQFRRLIPLEEDNTSTTDILQRYGLPLENFSTPFSVAIYDKRSIFFDNKIFEKEYFDTPTRQIVTPRSPSLREGSEEEEEGEMIEEEEFKENPIPPHCICSSEVFVMKYEKADSVDICDNESFAGEQEMGILGYLSKYGPDGQINYQKVEDGIDMEVHYSEEDVADEEDVKDTSKVPKIVSWNRSELCTEMLKQIFRFREFEGKLNFNLSKLMVGARTAFRKTGENEMRCLQFLKMCSLGPPHVVKNILCNYQISEELMDARGNNGVMFAAATDRHGVIEVLMNYGNDVNSFNDEGLTPLNLCLLRRLACANKISNWETAFLPKETDESQYQDSQAHRYPPSESIDSLDRVFGDGMSLGDSIVNLDATGLSPPSSPVHKGSLERRSQSDKTEISKTCLAVSPTKVQGSLSVINWDWDFRFGKSLSFIAVSNPTPTLNEKLVPKSVRRDEFQKSIQKTSRDKYLFEISFEKAPDPTTAGGSISSIRRKQTKKEEDMSHTEGLTEIDLIYDFDVLERIEEIDKTINLLLKKGADPNLSEVPKPTIHLGIYTKDFQTVYNLLLYGANPNSVLHSNEGQLTPLHVLVLQKPAPEFVKICQLLLNFKANPDKETLPGFSTTEEEKEYLDPEKGRTPLHLLCMRPDLEYADPKGDLIKIALMLARASQKKHFYNGHSYLTLAMLFGNMKLLQALIHFRIFDPTEVLGKNRGTCLHVLVSGELQKRTNYDNSIKMCDLLLRAGADPLKTFKHPPLLLGTCVDYGYRELGALRQARLSDEYKGIKRSFTKGRDSLKDHERVLQYLVIKASELAKARHKTNFEVGRFQRYKPSTDRWKPRRSRSHRSTSEVRGMASTSQVTVSSKDSGKWSREDKTARFLLPEIKTTEKEKKEKAEEVEKTTGKEKTEKAEEVEKTTEKEKTNAEVEKTTVKESAAEELKQGSLESTKMKKSRSQMQSLSFNRVVEELDPDALQIRDARREQRRKKDSVALMRSKVGSKHKGKDRETSIEEDNASPSSKMKGKAKLGRRETFEGEEKEKVRVGRGKAKPGRRETFEGEEKEKVLVGRGKAKPGRRETFEGEEKETVRIGRGKAQNVRRDTFGREERETIQFGRGKGKPVRRDTFGREQGQVMRSGRVKKMKGATDDGKGLTYKGKIQKGQTQTGLSKEEKQRGFGYSDKNKYSSDARERERSQGRDTTNRGLNMTGADTNTLGEDVPSVRTMSNGRLTTAEVFPEKLRKVLLRLYGNCINMDINEFLMPYVVLRDGQLYYKFKGKATKQKEQYSLI